MTLTHLLRPELADLTSYVPVQLEGIEVRLDANEAPPNPSPRLRETIANAIARTALERYPDARATDLKDAIALRTGAPPSSLLVGTGSDEVISLLACALARPNGNRPVSILSVVPTFVMYRITARAHGIVPGMIPLDSNWDLDVPAIEKAIDHFSPNIIFIASPNNPTGNRMSEERLRAVVAAAPSSLVVIDEAYIDFAKGPSLRAWREAHANVGILRTLSKVGLAALRIGWLEADPALVFEIDKARQPFNTSATSQAAVTAVLRDAWDDVMAHVSFVRSERERVSQALAASAHVTPSEANFLWVRTAQPAGDVFDALVRKGVLVRSFHQTGGRMANQLRITIGTRAENDRLVEVLASCAR